MQIELDKSRSKTDQIYALLRRGKSIDAITAKFVYGVTDLPGTLSAVRKKFDIPKENFTRVRITLTEALLDLEKHDITIVPNAFDESNKVSKYKMRRK